ncbi:hypothetical protein OG413_45285 [Streptomyces sp. NBC_01433]|uniref:hypothetical protein n=1 Tax=Streptomyces sp. NBC_01433 TaxID=2903864 RepID=UPI002256D9D3|nr:hypothetical protein [Streptomyces sp. NBC_01433]MCX4681325.1 hypothetical protein [Streptomyces sp. NBC_01433]MCX4681736.1 hypothetical protein [Streptomyces sp. NBC_01433]MCX4682401.1 hypothetical protein [Streptomyces sp. NBC_01433]
MLGSDGWTPDSIAHALPVADMRQEFWKQFNLTPIGELPELGERWVKVIESLEAGVERGLELHLYQHEHGGDLPPEYSDVTGLITESQAA